ncbi:MAG: hypothetical protein ACKVZ0_09220 [Gemmatimonadales bacterium]
MFDYLRCRYPLPDGFTDDLEYQTKDTPAQCLEHYSITEDGRLLHQEVEYLETPKAERPYPDAPNDSLEGIVGSISVRAVGEVLVPFNGVVEFYTSNVVGVCGGGYLTDDGLPERYRVYTAEFADGKVVAVKGGLRPSRTTGKLMTRDEFRTWVRPSPGTER